MPSATSSTNCPESRISNLKSQISIPQLPIFSMKHDSFHVRRTPVKPGLFRKLHAATRPKRQKVTAAPAYDDDYDDDDGGSKISRSLVIIFLFHIVLIGLIFVHYRYLRNRTPDAAAEAAPVAAQVAQAPNAAGETTHIVRQGEDYPQIAGALGVLETDLRALNQNAAPHKGMLMRVPPPRPVIPVAAAPTPAPSAATATPVVSPTTPAAAVPTPAQPALVPAVDVTNAPRARAVTAQTADAAPARSATAASSYTVRPGDSIILIAKRHKVQPDALIKANRIADPKKIRPGMKLTIPAS
jgi:LysM repeat protein